MARHPLRLFLDLFSRTVPPDADAPAPTSAEAFEPVARPALDEVSRWLLSAARSGAGGPGRELGERVFSLMRAALGDAGGAALPPGDRDALAGLALVGLIRAAGGPAASGRRVRRPGTSVDVEDLLAEQASRQRSHDLTVASLEEDAAELRVRVEMLEAKRFCLEELVADLRLHREMDVRERLGLDTARSIGPRGRPSGPLN